MSDETDLIKVVSATHTLLKAHVKTSDERHKAMSKTLEKHDLRITKNTGFRNWITGIISAGGLGTGVVTGVKHFFGGGS